MRTIMAAGALILMGAGCSSPPDEESATSDAAAGAAGATADDAPIDAGGSVGVPASAGAGAPAATDTQPGVRPAMAGSATEMSGSASTTVQTNADLPPATGGPIREECRGFDFEGLVHSPGGDALPNKCEAFHPTLNNPYAVRCVDVWPWWSTNYPGDSFCILPPPPDKGIQVGHHPQGEGDAWFNAVSNGDMSAYEDPPADWTLAPGGEEERNILVKHTNMGGKYYRLYTRMRGGSHHMIVSADTFAGDTFAWYGGSAEGLFIGDSIPGAQRPDENLPQALHPPEEDAGLYRQIPANATVKYDVHHFNSTDKFILKEAWQNLWWTENPTIAINQINGVPLLQAVGTFAQPGEIVDMHYAISALDEMRVLGVFGHRHAWTTSFSAWIERSSGANPELIYQSFDWFDEPTFNYSSVIENPTPSQELRTDGGSSGILVMSPGDTLHFNCHIEYTDERAQEENSPIRPAENGPLRFANEAYTAEMCILFGEAVGNYGAAVQLGPPPEFARIR